MDNNAFADRCADGHVWRNVHMEHSHIGRYEVVRVLGQGAMGVVFEALDPRLARRVAIKTIRAENLSAEQSRTYEARFDTEARSVARLAHPNIVSVYDSGQIDAMSYLVMEFVPGVNLKDCLRAGVRFSPWGSVRIVLEVLAALGHAHEQRIIHRDIKPENILLDAGGRVKLTDFGIAKMLDAEVDNGTHLSGGSIGTPRYMSPEQVRGAPLDERSDLFSVGVLLYELLTGKPPFDGGSAIAIATAILHDEPEPPSLAAPGVMPALDAVLSQALAKGVQDRFASSQAFAQALMSVTADGPEPDLTVHADGLSALVTSESQEALRVLQRELRTESAVSDAPTQASVPAEASTTEDGTRLYLSDAGEVRRVSSPHPETPSQASAGVLPLPPNDTQAHSRRRFAWMAAAASGLVVVAFVVWWALRPVSSPIADPALSLSDKEALVTPSAPTVPTSAAAADREAGTGGATSPPPDSAASAKPNEVGAAAVAASPATKSPTAPVALTRKPPAASAVSASGAPAEAGAVAPSPPAPAGAATVQPAPAATPSTPAATPTRHPAEPCAGLGFFERESCLWKQCRTDSFRKHPVCERFQDRPAVQN